MTAIRKTNYLVKNKKGEYLILSGEENGIATDILDNKCFTHKRKKLKKALKKVESFGEYSIMKIKP